MRTVSACAWARVQSRLNAAAAAAEFLSSVLREVGIVSSPNCCFRLAFLAFGRVSWGMRRKVNTHASHGGSWRPAEEQGRAKANSAEAGFMIQACAAGPGSFLGSRAQVPLGSMGFVCCQRLDHSVPGTKRTRLHVLRTSAVGH